MGIPLKAREVRIATTGGAGAATGQATLTLGAPARLIAVRLDYDATAPATTDVTISNMGRNVLAVSNTGTDAVKQPREQTVDAANAAVPAGDGERWAPFVLHGTVTIDVAQSNALDPAVIVTLLFEP